MDTQDYILINEVINKQHNRTTLLLFITNIMTLVVLLVFICKSFSLDTSSTELSAEKTENLKYINFETGETVNEDEV